MADRTIDFNKVDKAFQNLADTKEGQAALRQLQSAIEGVSAATGVKLTAHETNYVASNLVKQRQSVPGKELREVGGRVVENFHIKTAVPE